MSVKIHYLSTAVDSPWEDGTSQLDGLPIRDSGGWIEKKHKPLVYYSEIFNKAMESKPWDHRVYFELFSGPGRCHVRETMQEEQGSPLKVLNTNFTKFIFVEMNIHGAKALAARIKGHPNEDRVEIWCGDCLQAITKIQFAPRSLVFTFIDPTRIGHAPFELIEILNQKTRSDILLNIPVGTDIKRNLHNYLPKRGKDAPLTRYCGTEDWVDLPQNTPSNFCREFFKLYEKQLRKLNFHDVGDMDRVTTSNNVPLYYLLFASHDPLGKKFWNETKKRVNAPEFLF